MVPELYISLRLDPKRSLGPLSCRKSLKNFEPTALAHKIGNLQNTMELHQNTSRYQILGALPPPPGVIPNFSKSSLGYVVATVTVCLVVTTLVVWAPLYTVFCILKSHGWADCRFPFVNKLVILTFYCKTMFSPY